jgi:uncharacterized membrane protein YfcA
VTANDLALAVIIGLFVGLFVGRRIAAARERKLREVFRHYILAIHEDQAAEQG